MNLRDATARDSWRLLAACRGSAASTFYPETPDEVAAAKRICARCPVQKTCLETALRNGERHGVWGGLTERERARSRRRSLRAA